MFPKPDPLKALHLPFLIAALFSLLMTEGKLFAQTAQWEQLHGPYGRQRILSMHADGERGTVSLGVFGAVLQSRNEGDTWEVLPLEGSFVFALTVDGSGRPLAGTIWGLYRYDFATGDWWSFPEVAAYSIWCLDRNPVTGSLFAGCHDGTLLVSTDDGATWEDTRISPDVGGAGDLFHDAAGNMYAITGGLWKSTDDGTSWQRIGTDMFGDNVGTIVHEPVADVLVAGRADLIAVSNDGGITWEKTDFTGSTNGANMTLCAGRDGLLLAGTSCGLYESTDAGRHWERCDRYIADTVITSLGYLGANDAYIAVCGRKVYARSADGEKWSLAGAPSDPVACLHVTGSGRLFAGMPGCVAVSEDGGETWFSGVTPLVNAIAVDESDGVAYAATVQGLHASTDGGWTWGAVDAGFRSRFVAAVQLLPGGALLAGTASIDSAGGIYLRRERNGSWEEITSGLADVDVSSIVVDPLYGSVYAGMYSGRLFRSDDGGEHWTALPAEFPEAPTIAASAAGLLYVGSSKSGLHCSTDRGEHWTSIGGDTVGRARIEIVETNAAGHCFASCANQGLFASTDRGNSWIRFDAGLSNSSIWSLAVDPGRYLLAGMYCGGVFRTMQPTMESEAPALSAGLDILGQNYPNPFTHSTEIRVASELPLHGATLRVFDLLGREVLDLSDVLRSGAPITITPAMLPASGVYHYQLRFGHEIQTRSMILMK